MSGKRSRPPQHLKPATRRWWSSVVRDYELEPHHTRILQLAGEAWDRCEQARKAIDEHGLTFIDRFGCPRTRPEAAVERDSRIAFARLIRELDLDVEPPVETKRAPQLHRFRGGLRAS